MVSVVGHFTILCPKFFAVKNGNDHLLHELAAADPQVRLQPVTHFPKSVEQPSQSAYPNVQYLLSARA